jgi:acyl-coenzyme A synthetase/AMP-(fatty) acid ligase
MIVKAMSEVTAEYRKLEAGVLAAMREERDEAECDALGLEVFRFQRRWNQPYANFCATRPAPNTWWEIPAVPLTAFKHATLSVVRPELVTKTFLTSGTTGESRGLHHFFDTRLYEYSVQYGWARLGLPKHRQFVLVPSNTHAPQSSLSHMMATLGINAISQTCFIDAGGGLQLESLVEVLDAEVAAARPVALLGSALGFLNCFERFGERRFVLPAGSYAMETGGYKGSGREIPKAELYAMFGEYLGLTPADIINEYGMTELSSQFYTRGLGQPHEGGPWVRAIVFDPETGNEVAVGEMGALRIFDLANLSSVLAIETQDLAIRREQGFELIGRDPAALPRGCSRTADERMRG